MNELTAEEYKWLQENTLNYKRIVLGGEEYAMLTLKNGNAVIGTTIEDAVRREMGEYGVVVSLDGFETDEINSLLWDE